MGRKRFKVIRKHNVKPPPTIFNCPICTKKAVRVYHQKNSDNAEVSCGNCMVSAKIKWLPSYDAVDAYAEFIDKITKENKITKEDSRVVSFVNYKGGVGKTTLAVEISAALAYYHEKKVLLVDADPQTNATFYLMEEDMWGDIAQQRRTIKELFDAVLYQDHTKLQEFNMRNIIIDKGLQVHKFTNNLHLIPSHLDLHEIDLKLASQLGKGESSLIILWQAIRNIKTDYDYIIIDCPPNMYLVTQNAITASNGVIVTLLPEYLSRIGITLIDRIIRNINSRMEQHARIFGGEFKNIQIRGIIFNRVRYGAGGILRDHLYNIEEIKRVYRNLVFETFLRESVKITQRPFRRIPISVSEYPADKQYREEIRQITREFLSRFES